MHEPRAVRRTEPARDLEQPRQFLRLGDVLAREAVAQRAAGHELHRDVRVPVDLADVVHRDDVGVVERRGRARLAHRPRPRDGTRAFVRPLGEHDLERDAPAEPWIEGEVDAAHSPFAEDRLDHVAIDGVGHLHVSDEA